jgi:hypothetical protein
MFVAWIEPVIPLFTVKEFKEASEPLTITRFQFGIYMFIMVGYNNCVLPTSLSGL